MTNNESELKPCAHCNKQKIKYDGYYYECENCGSKSPAGMWNTRHPVLQPIDEGEIENEIEKLAMIEVPSEQNEAFLEEKNFKKLSKALASRFGKVGVDEEEYKSHVKSVLNLHFPLLSELDKNVITEAITNKLNGE